MKESDRLISLFQKLYNGSPWIDVNLVSTLSKITASQAQKKALPNANSIWEIINHLISWRINVLQRMQGKQIKTPDNNYFEPVKDGSDTAWKETLHQLETTHKEWIDFLSRIETTQFENIYPGNEMTYYEHIQGILQHDTYHLGQVVLLSKYV